MRLCGHHQRPKAAGSRLTACGPCRCGGPPHITRMPPRSLEKPWAFPHLPQAQRLLNRGGSFLLYHGGFFLRCQNDLASEVGVKPACDALNRS